MRVRTARGFTLIELILVIMLIMVLSGVVLTVLRPSGIRAKARDSQRVADIKKVQSALEIYFFDHRGYPAASSWTRADAISGLSSYLSPIPVDPLSTGTDPCDTATRNYYYQSDGNRYILTSNMEVGDDAVTSSCVTANLGCSAPANCYMSSGPGGPHTAGSSIACTPSDLSACPGCGMGKVEECNSNVCGCSACSGMRCSNDCTDTGSYSGGSCNISGTCICF